MRAPSKAFSKALSKNAHRISIHAERGEYMMHTGSRASCICGWSSDCYAFFHDVQRAIEVHLRRSRTPVKEWLGQLAGAPVRADIARITRARNQVRIK